MAEIALQNIPDSLYQALADRAAKHRHSLEQEAIECMDAGIRLSERYVEGVEQRLNDLRQFRESLGSIFLSEQDLHHAKQEGRP